MFSTTLTINIKTCFTFHTAVTVDHPRTHAVRTHRFIGHFPSEPALAGCPWIFLFNPVNCASSWDFLST